MRTTMPGCVIFDCDGTLVDSEYLCNEALRIQLENEGIFENVHALIARYRGAKLQGIVDDLQTRHDIRFQQNFLITYRELVSGLFARELRPVDGVVDALSLIGLPMCVASSGPQEKIRQALQVTGLSNYFADRIFSSYEIGSWKPEPDLFMFAAKKMGAVPKQCVVVEDSEIGIIAAKAAGMRPLWYVAAMTGDVIMRHPEVEMFDNMAALPALLSKC